MNNLHLKLFERSEAKINYSLERIRRFSHAFNTPESCYKCIHIAGTNGKGSVAQFITQGLEGAGFKVGLFTSPHLFEVNERIQVNQKKISDESLERLYLNIVEKERDLNETLTFFECITLIAFLYFKENNIDFAVIEAGLGGRLDSTNILTPYMAIITSIGFDHTEYLGEILEKIAEEKAGILKDCEKIVIGPNTPGLKLNQAHTKVKGPFDNFMEENRAIAQSALFQLGITNSHSFNEPPCRMQILEKENFKIILDGAHNAPALEQLFSFIKQTFPNKSIKIAFSLSKTKDIKMIAKILRTENRDIYLIKNSHPRLYQQSALYDRLIEEKIPEKNLHLPSSFREIIENESDQNTIFVITGSFFHFSLLKEECPHLFQ